MGGLGSTGTAIVILSIKVNIGWTGAKTEMSAMPNRYDAKPPAQALDEAVQDAMVALVRAAMVAPRQLSESVDPFAWVLTSWVLSFSFKNTVKL